MDEEAILRQRVDGWVRLNSLTLRAEGGFKNLSGPELDEFVRLYRKASADLAFLSTQTSNAEVVTYLNGLVARAYGQIYRTPSKPFVTVVTDSVTASARTVRKYAWAFWLSFAIFFAGAVFAFQMLHVRPDLREYFVSKQEEPIFDHWKKGKFEDSNSSESLAMWAFYTQHNPVVGIMVHSLSVATFGTFTVYELWRTGIQVGALGQDMNSVGKLGFLVTSIVPHGVSEIGGALVSGSGGFVLAWALINPGRRPRGAALKAAGKDAVVLLLTGLVMIGIAAPFEGFFSFNPRVPQIVKPVVALLVLSGWIAFFYGYGREAPTESVA